MDMEIAVQRENSTDINKEVNFLAASLPKEEVEREVINNNLGGIGLVTTPK